MYEYRRKMVRLLMIGVLANLLMGALLQVAKSTHEDEEGPFKVLAAAVCLFFVGLCIRICREVHGEFKLDKKFSWEQGGGGVYATMGSGDDLGLGGNATRRRSGGERRGSYQQFGGGEGGQMKEPILDLGV